MISESFSSEVPEGQIRHENWFFCSYISPTLNQTSQHVR